MKITSKILNKINESVENASDTDYKEFNKQIDFLIKDEEEAIDGYTNALETLVPITTDYQYNKIAQTLTHIIDEEKGEHIFTETLDDHYQTMIGGTDTNGDGKADIEPGESFEKNNVEDDVWSNQSD